MTFYKSCIIYVICSLLIGNFCYGSTGNKAYKIIVIGEGKVGKTRLITQLTQKTFDAEDYTPVHKDKSLYEYECDNGTKYKFDIWDPLCPKPQASTNKIFCRQANGIMAVYDITNKSSFESLEEIINSFF